jgi:urease
VEGTFRDGVFLVTVHDPIASEDGDIVAALSGSFFPIPSNDLFPVQDQSLYSREKLPGAIIARKEDIVINKGRERVRLRVTNTGDRPVQIGSHYHFIEANAALSFDRGRAYGKRLDIPAGTAVRFEPGDVRTVTLCTIGGARIISGGNFLATGPLNHASLDAILSRLQTRGFLSTPEPDAPVVREDTLVSREAYVSMFGPTTGDRIRLGDTELWIEVERDEVSYQYDAQYPLILCRRCTATKSSSVEANPSVKVWDKQRTVPHQRPLTLSLQMLS